MTAEVIIMNREAVALAADSAVTFQSGKIFNSANKLYMLAPGYSVGVLVFNNAAFMGVSWELIIKLYRDVLVSENKRLDNLQDYAKNFVSFIENNEALLFPKEVQADYFKATVQMVMERDIFKAVNKAVERYIVEHATPVRGHKILDIARAKIDKICEEWEQSPDLFDASRNQEIAEKMEQQYRSIFEQCYQSVLGGLGLEEKDKDRLWNHCILWFTKERWFNNRFSGICFAGYGDKDIYPSFVQYQFESYMCGMVKYLKVRSYSAEETSGVFPFAQTDIISMVISGVHEHAWNSLNKLVVNRVGNTYKSLLSRLPTPPSDIDMQASQMAQHDYESVVKELQKEMLDKYTMSIMVIVQSLPKDELALMAETLVNTTSYMRRVSRGQETVGGPTDVAVISKKDGFIWIKRKHYFDAECNYHFFK